MSDLNKLRKSFNKKGIMTEMNDPTEWISTGNGVLNYRLTGRIDVGLCNKRSLLLWGRSGTGKSFLASNLAKNAQDKGYKIIYIDSEQAASYDYMEKVGVDTSEEWFIPALVDTIEDVTEALSDIFNTFDSDDKFMIVIDSLAGLLSKKELEEFEKGEAKGDQGQIAKKLKLMVKNINNKISQFDAFCVMVTHAYRNQDMYSSDGKFICTGGDGFQFFPSFSVLLDKATMKDKTQNGIRIKAQVTKTRFTAPFQKCELTVPYDTGLDFADGLLDVLEEEGVVQKNGAWYRFEKDGESVPFQAKNFMEHYEDLLEIFNKDLVEESDS